MEGGAGDCAIFHMHKKGTAKTYIWYMCIHVHMAYMLIPMGRDSRSEKQEDPR